MKSRSGLLAHGFALGVAIAALATTVEVKPDVKEAKTAAQENKKKQERCQTFNYLILAFVFDLVLPARLWDEGRAGIFPVRSIT